MKNFKYAVIILSAFFCLGIMGSLELGRISFSDACEYVFAAAAACVFAAFAEISIKVIKIYSVRLARRLKAKSKNSASACSLRRPQTHGLAAHAGVKYN